MWFCLSLVQRVKKEEIRFFKCYYYCLQCRVKTIAKHVYLHDFACHAQIPLNRVMHESDAHKTHTHEASKKEHTSHWEHQHKKRVKTTTTIKNIVCQAKVVKVECDWFNHSFLFAIDRVNLIVCVVDWKVLFPLFFGFFFFFFFTSKKFVVTPNYNRETQSTVTNSCRSTIKKRRRNLHENGSHCCHRTQNVHLQIVKYHEMRIIYTVQWKS